METQTWVVRHMVDVAALLLSSAALVLGLLAWGAVAAVRGLRRLWRQRAQAGKGSKQQ